MKPLTMLALVACAYALYMRRSTWGCKWDTAVTLGLVFQGLNIVAQLPIVGELLGPWLRYIYGVWNAEDLIGHLMYLAGLACVLYMALSRLKLTDEERRRLLRTRIELPAMIVIPLAALLFVLGAPDYDVHSLTAEKLFPAMSAYWVLIVVAMLYLVGNTIWALLIIYRNPASRATARMYLLASFVTVLACAVGAVDLVIPIPIAAWTVIRLDLLAYAWAGVYSWNQRRQTLPGKKLEPA